MQRRWRRFPPGCCCQQWGSVTFSHIKAFLCGVCLRCVHARKWGVNDECITVSKIDQFAWSLPRKVSCAPPLQNKALLSEDQIELLLDAVSRFLFILAIDLSVLTSGEHTYRMQTHTCVRLTSLSYKKKPVRKSLKPPLLQNQPAQCEGEERELTRLQIAHEFSL